MKILILFIYIILTVHLLEAVTIFIFATMQIKIKIVIPIYHILMVKMKVLKNTKYLKLIILKFKDIRFLDLKLNNNIENQNKIRYFIFNIKK